MLQPDCYASTLEQARAKVQRRIVQNLWSADIFCGISQPTVTIGLDLGDRNCWYCILDQAGQIQTRADSPIILET